MSLQTEEAFFIVMEFAEGGTLASKVHKDLSSSDTRKWALQLVKVLVYMHEQGVSHRDLKPENVLLSAAGDIKVIRAPLHPPLCCQPLAMHCCSRSRPCLLHGEAQTLSCVQGREAADPFVDATQRAQRMHIPSVPCLSPGPHCSQTPG